MSIELTSLCYSYNAGSRFAMPALRDVNLLFSDHEFTALIGKTGSGKSTLIQHLNALLLPTSGSVRVGDYVIDMSLVYKTHHGVVTDIVNKHAMKKKHKAKLKDIKSLRRRVGLVFQFPEYQIFEETVLKDVCYGPKNFGATPEEADKAAKRALMLVGLDSSYYERSPFELSGGEKRRVAIAGIIALSPEVLVLDEPTVGLDPAGEANLLNLLEEIHATGTSIILATHDMDVVLKYATRAIVLEKGRIVHDTTPLALFQNANFLVNSSLEPPRVFRLAMTLIDKGLPLNLGAIKDSDSLADEIIRVRKDKVL
jgi:energy-coupling factor transport system ATP-binding protein